MGQLTDLLRASLARLDTARYELRATDVDAAFTFMGEGARLLGAAIPQVAALEAGPVPPPDPPPPPAPPPTLQGFGGSYPGHDPACDLYLGTDATMGEWGQHWGHDVLAPAAGLVTAYTFPTPLSAPAGLGRLVTNTQAVALYYQAHDDLFQGIAEPGTCYTVGQTLYMALLTFDTPQPLSNGQSVRAIWIGHCRGNIAAGRVSQGDRWCTTWNSGIDFERQGIPALASHAHVCGTVSGALTMNGEVSGFLVAELLGWQVRHAGGVPGPNDYMTGAYRAGKPLSAWQGRTLPPSPPS